MSEDSQPEYRYLQEISQMMFVFGDVVDPHPDVLKLVEDIVRNQVIELMLQSRALSARRSSRFLSPEDLIFLIRYDRAKVNRLRTYLSWKDVRKNAKDSGGDAGAAGPDVPEGDDAVDNPVKSRIAKIRLPWDIQTVYSEHLTAPGGAGDEREEEDEDDIEAHQDSLQRLKDADEATRRMTREEYVHYSECRQASFTFRKGKRFREFINAGAYLDVKPNDDIIDILGFLAFETVRELCLGALAIKQALEEEAARAKKHESSNSSSSNNNIQAINGARKGTMTTASASGQEGEAAQDNDVGDTSMESNKTVSQQSTASSSSLKKRKADSSSQGEAQVQKSSAKTSPSKRARHETPPPNPANGNGRTSPDPSPSSHSSNGSLTNGQSARKAAATEDGAAAAAEEEDDEKGCGLFTMPPAKASPLLPSHILEAFARLQRGRAALSAGKGGYPGGLRRTRVFVI
ncbi:TFIID-18kDa-domain-containing protein [Acaromyces ingoldii]|uniref:TFIID-18kDa-domain-containing protein n=1 Tax=Acaromyces ingoldii TaxID=215250 RepID=A0A316YP67_9BASI|nr:TFIID-18kDa-domain-containing protein [Acaromyces ingoldii]PWN91177.1 TFIID-18kDa-domain-containing protein [Acaromyces ingoldii]